MQLDGGHHDVNAVDQEAAINQVDPLPLQQVKEVQHDPNALAIVPY